MDITPGTQIGPNGARLPIAQVGGVVVEHPELVQVYGQPGPSKVIKWNNASQRAEWVTGDVGPAGAAGPAGPAGNTELAYAQSLVNALSTVVAAADVAGLAITPTVGARPIVLEVEGTLQSTAAAVTQAYVSIYEGATLIVEWQVSLVTQFALVSFSRRKRLSPAAGNHTYTVRLRTGTAGNQVGFIAGTSGQATSVSAIER